MLLRFFRMKKTSDLSTLSREECFYVETDRTLSEEETELFQWLITEPLSVVRRRGFLDDTDSKVIEIGPRLSVETPFSSGAVLICRAIGLPVRRVEKSVRVWRAPLCGGTVRMGMGPLTEMGYEKAKPNIYPWQKPEPGRIAPPLAQGEDALRKENTALGLGMDEWDIVYYTSLFKKLGRDPTTVELFQLGNANSEHSRHWYFRGIQILDGKEMPESLMDLVKKPLALARRNSITAFHDNAGVIRGTGVPSFSPVKPGTPSVFGVENVLQHITATAETHNHPTLIAPRPGAETGAGGRIRDNRAVGRGGLVHAGLAGYCVGNLHIPKFPIPGETSSSGTLSRVTASPLEILIEGSNGISDYGNKIGEPLIGGFCRSFGLNIQGALREFRKPVLYTAGLGRVRDEHVQKKHPEAGAMCVVRIGGPAYRIGVGGGSASSMIHGNQSETLDFKSVQRGDAEMENRANRVVQACAELGEKNPIESIHDQGAGGPSNVITELVAPEGGIVNVRNISVGDATMSVLELWVAEYQEGYGLLIRPKHLNLFKKICAREHVNCEVLGSVTGTGDIVVRDSWHDSEPVHLSLSDILSEMPPKRFASERKHEVFPPLSLPRALTVALAARRVFLLPQVGSKGFLVRKVDRSVTGLVVRQQCCGPTQVPVADAAVTADGYFGTSGAVTALGEQPVKMLVSPAKGARMAVAEMLTNLAGVKISALEDVKCRANWMWAAKRPHEGAALYDAAQSMSTFMCALGIAVDGGKDSLSMATMSDGILVVSLGELVIMGYAPVPTIEKIVTPDLKGGTAGFHSIIAMIDLGLGKNRLGGGGLAQTFGQTGSEEDIPDIDPPGLLVRAFKAIQKMVDQNAITAYHDRSDGGLFTTVAEMCISGNRGVHLTFDEGTDTIARLFNEEAGMVVEDRPKKGGAGCRLPQKMGIPLKKIGITTHEKNLRITIGTKDVFREKLSTVRGWWEETSSRLERLQSAEATAEAEHKNPESGTAPGYRLSFVPKESWCEQRRRRMPRVAILREEGTNGDREMAAAFHLAGFEACDITMSDLREGRPKTLGGFRGLVFPGGFSYADVFGSAKGWAGQILWNERMKEMFTRFYEREDTFSLGVCNGFQLMAWLGWLPWNISEEPSQVRLVENTSGRFESRWV